MNRIGRGYNPRLSTPGRSPMNNDDWYNNLYQQAWQEFQAPVEQAKKQRSVDYQNTNFGNFAEAYGFDSEKFLNDRLQQLLKQPEAVEEIPEINVSNTPQKTSKELDEERRVLKEKKYLEGLINLAISTKSSLS